ncbi:hypothetical protein pipiens_013615 [Culex pipiens pipiens]|uniref:Uncharacterized protein n=1 Tax=Culex pipiens pipiens TaxID=38569 RepID=A0ABD1CY77_CULPP
MRYSKKEHDIFMYQYIQGGAELYEDFQRANTVCPSKRTIQRSLQKKAQSFEEGKLLIHELVEFLDRNNLPKDPTHTSNKLRVKVLKKDAELILGKYKVSRVHLEQLIDKIDKTVHGLSATDINESDKMKFQPAEKMAQQRVIDALHDEIPDSDATVLYLTMMKDIMEVFIKNSSRDVVSPTEAVVKIW